MIARLVLFVALLGFVPIPAFASGKPLALQLSPAAISMTEGQSATFSLTKSGGNGHVTAAKITTSDGSYSASIMPGSTFTVPTKDDSIVNGTRTVTVTATASTGAKATATITILDNDKPAQSWTKCADEGGSCAFVPPADVRYGSGTAWFTRSLTTSPVACDNQTWGDPIYGTVKECDTTAPVAAPAPAPAPPPSPPPPSPGNWLAAPLAEGGYAEVVNAGPGAPSGDLAGGFDVSCCYRSSVAGEYVKLLPQSFGYSPGGVKTCLVVALADNAAMELKCADLAGVVPSP